MRLYFILLTLGLLLVSPARGIEPADEISKGRFIEWAMIAAGQPLRLSASSTGFDDVPAEHRFYPYIQSARELGFVQAVEGTNNFAPDGPLTKQEAAQMLLLSFGYHNIPVCSEPPFADVSVNDWGCRYIQQLKSLKALQGLFVKDKDIKFFPGALITHATAMKMIAVMHGIKQGYNHPFGYIWDTAHDQVTGGYEHAVAIGQLFEQDVSANVSPVSFEIRGASQIRPNQTTTFSIETSCGHCRYYWEATDGSFSPLAADFSKVSYTAPRNEKTVYLYGFVSDGQGAALMEKRAITVSSDGNDGELSVTFNAGFSPTDEHFHVNYQADTAVTLLQLEYSFDNENWQTIVELPLGDAHIGRETFTLEDSAQYAEVHFRIGTRITEDDPLVLSEIYTLQYEILPPYEEKATELPVAPLLHAMNETQGGRTITLSWQKVVDSRQNDNARYYEVMHANNFRFDNETVYRAENTATTPQTNENIQFTLAGVVDNATHYFKVRAVNDVGSGSWSNVESSYSNIQDWPVFSEDFSPANNEESVIKQPNLCWQATDDEGDELEYSVQWGYSPGDLKFRVPFNQGQECLDFAIEGLGPLKPNVNVYWQVLVREKGYYKDYYGGSYVTSDIHVFSTQAVGQDLSIIDARQIGELQFNGYVEFEVTVKNFGSEDVPATWIDAFYIKNNVESEFLSGSVLTPQILSPGVEVALPITVKFRDTLWISPSGEVIDNVLIEGDSRVLFRTKFIAEQEVNPNNNENAVNIFYQDNSGPIFEAFEVNTDHVVADTGEKFSKQGGQIQVVAKVRDETAVTSAKIEYKLFDSINRWALLASYSGDAETLNMEYNAQGEKIGRTGHSFEWQLPPDLAVTNELKIRMTAVDSQNNVSEIVSQPVSIAHDHLLVTIGELEQSEYTVGDPVTLNVSVDSHYPVEQYAVTLDDGRRTWSLLDVTEGDVPAAFRVTLPQENSAATRQASIKVWVSAGFANATEVSSQSFILNPNTALPEPFSTAIKLYDPPSEPNRALLHNSAVVPTFVEIDENGLAHVVYHHFQQYFNRDHQFIDNSYYYYGTVDASTKAISPHINLPSGFAVTDLKLLPDGSPFFLLEAPNQLAYASIKDGQLSDVSYLQNRQKPSAVVLNKGNLGVDRPYIINERLYHLSDIQQSIDYYAFRDGYAGNKFTMNLSGQSELAYNAQKPWLITHLNDMIYFVDTQWHKLVSVDVSNLTLSAVDLPHRYNASIDESDGRPKMALTTLNDVVYLVMRGDIYKLDNGLVEVKSLVHEYEHRRVDYKTNWQQVEEIRMVVNADALSMYIASEPSMGLPNPAQVTILNYLPVTDSFNLPVFKPLKMYHKFPDGLRSAGAVPTNIADTLDLGDGKMLVAYEAPFNDQQTGIEHRDVAVSIYDMNTGAAFYLGHASNGVKGPFASSTPAMLQLSRNIPFIILGGKALRINIIDLSMPLQYFAEPKLHLYQEQMFVTYDHGVEYDGRDGNVVEDGIHRANIELAPLGEKQVLKLHPLLGNPKPVSSTIMARDLNGMTRFGDFAYVEQQDFYALTNSFTIADNSLCQFEQPQGQLVLSVDSLNYLAVLTQWVNGVGQFKLLNKDCSVNRLIEVPVGDSDIWHNGKLKGVLTDNAFVLYGFAHPDTYLFQYDIDSQVLSSLVLPIQTVDVSKTISINSQTDSAVGWTDAGAAYLAFANVGGDVIDPLVTLTANKTQAGPGAVVKLTWEATDNDEQLSSFKLYAAIPGQADELLTEITDTEKTFYDYTIPVDTQARQIYFRIVATDTSNNWAVSSAQVKITQPVTIESFTTDKNNYMQGEDILFSWVLDGAEVDDNVQLLMRSDDSSPWMLLAENIVGNNFAWHSTNESGAFVFKLFVRGQSQELAVSISGEQLLFNEDNFAPVSDYYIGWADPVLQFSWDADIAPGDDWYAQLFVKTEHDDKFELIDTSQNKQFKWHPHNEFTELSWYVNVTLNGVDFSSDIQSLDVHELPPVSGAVINVFNEHTTSPRVELRYEPPMDGVSVMILRSINFEDFKVIKEVTESSFLDNEVLFGDTVGYRLVNRFGPNFSEYVETEHRTLSTRLPRGVELAPVVGSDPVLRTNSILTITPVAEPEEEVFEYYEVLLGFAGQDEAFWQSIEKTQEDSFSLPNLIHGEVYTVKVYALTPDEQRVVGVSDEITFAAPFNYEPLSATPVIFSAEAGYRSMTLQWTAIVQAEQYSIYRSEDGGQWSLIQSVLETSFEDVDVAVNTPYRYFVRASNPISFRDSSPTDTLVIDTEAPIVTPPADLTVSAVGPGGTAATDPAIVEFLAGARATEGVLTHDAPQMFPIGVTVVTFRAVDARGNVGLARAAVIVVDDVQPVLVLNGNAFLTLNQGQTFHDPGATAFDNVDGDISNRVQVIGSVDTATIGLYELVYEVGDRAGNFAEPQTRTVNVQDSIAPVVYPPDDITVAAVDANGTPATIEEIAVFLTSASSNVGLVSHDAPTVFPLGATVVTFSAEDTSGNIGVGFAKVTVVDETSPVLTLNGPSVVRVALGGTYNELGASAIDNVNGDISAFVTIAGEVDVNAIGTYLLTYNVMDNAGNEAASVQRTIVVETNNPVNLFVEVDSIVEAAQSHIVKVRIGRVVTENVVVTLAYSGTAVRGEDYTANVEQVTIPRGQLEAEFEIISIQDNDVEHTETIVIDIVSVSGGHGVEDGEQQLTIRLIDDDGVKVSLSVTNDTISETDGEINVTAAVNQRSTEDVTVTFGFTGTARIGDDYEITANTVTIAPGEFRQSVKLKTKQDSEVEPDEVIIIDIVDVQGLAVENDEQQRQVGLIDDDVTKVDLFLTLENLQEADGHSTISATLEPPTYEDVVIDFGFSGTADLESDYQVSATSLVIKAGQTLGKIILTPVADTEPEADETVIVNILQLTGGNAVLGEHQQRSLNIVDDDSIAVTLAVDQLSLSETDGVSKVTATLEKAIIEDVDIVLSFAGTAEKGADYDIDSERITIKAGKTVATGTITAIDDTVIEQDETIIIDIAQVESDTAMVKQSQLQTLTLLDDDITEATLSIDNLEMAEAGDSGTISIQLTEPTYEDVLVELSFGGSATKGNDYVVAGSVLKVNKGALRGVLELTSIQDLFIEGNETIEVGVVSVSGGNAVLKGADLQTIKIIDDDKTKVRLTISEAEISEDEGISIVTASLTQPIDVNVTVNLSYSGTATLGQDYKAASHITIENGFSSGEMRLRALQDIEVELPETIVIDVTSVAGGTAVEDGEQQQSLNIISDDITLVNLSLSTATISEFYEVVTITASLTAPTYEDVIVTLAYGGTAVMAEDYVEPQNQLVIAKGETSATLEIKAMFDKVDDDGETIIIDIDTVSGGEAQENQVQQQIVSILNYEPVAPLAGWIYLLLESDEPAQKRQTQEQDEQDEQ